MTFFSPPIRNQFPPLKPKTKLTLTSPSSAALSKVSGGAAAIPACRLLLAAVSRLRDPPGDQQREAWRPVSHRHPENQEAAVGNAAAMM